MESLYQLLYLSSAKVEFTEEALLELLSASQSRNEKRNITGLLLHSDGSIIQILEGAKADVETLFRKIESDERHTGVMVLSRKDVKTRDFPEYKMGFRRTNQTTLNSNIPGFSGLVGQGQLTQGELNGLSTLVAVFLKTFAKSTGIWAD